MASGWEPRRAASSRFANDLFFIELISRSYRSRDSTPEEEEDAFASFDVCSSVVVVIRVSHSSQVGPGTVPVAVEVRAPRMAPTRPPYARKSMGGGGGKRNPSLILLQ